MCLADAGSEKYPTGTSGKLWDARLERHFHVYFIHFFFFFFFFRNDVPFIH